MRSHFAARGRGSGFGEKIRNLPKDRQYREASATDITIIITIIVTLYEACCGTGLVAAVTTLRSADRAYHHECYCNVTDITDIVTDIITDILLILLILLLILLLIYY
jgi:hypothetical protein